jgi:ferric-dicitrate binding protein FerR (iron transport regulator)
MTGLSFHGASATVNAPKLFARLFVATMLSIAANSAIAQSNQCELTPDERNPQEKVLHCGATLVVRTAPGTSYRATGASDSLELYDGALLLEFHPSGNHKTFQILTPHAIVAVRGTKWAVEVTSQRTSTLVIVGKVAVTRPSPPSGVVLGPGEGADVDKDSVAPLVVKRWPETRVRALLSRFGE